MEKFATKSLITLILCLLPIISYADVSKIVFTTDPQSIKPNELSGPITIQAQDSSGNSFQTPETVDLEFTSTSATGEFLGSTGNTATKYMSTNTANRTFYYRDSSSGSFIINISAKGRTSGKEWGASQPITVSVSAASASSNSSNTTKTTSSNTSISNNSSSQFSNTGAGSINQDPIPSSFDVFAGVDRLTSAGSPISFSANVKKNPGSSNKIEFAWSFGDGNVGGGQNTSHTYKYPGTYAVVLNATAGNYKTMSRLKVEVIEPEIKIKGGNGFVEISNLSDKEINLFNWKIKKGVETFIFQPDTIILPKSAVQFDNGLLRFDSSSAPLTLEDSLGRKINSPDQMFLATESFGGYSNNISLNLLSVEEEALALKDKIISVDKNEEEPLKGTTREEDNTKNTKEIASVAMAITPQATSTSNNSNIIYESSKKLGFISKLTNFIKRVLFH